MIKQIKTTLLASGGIGLAVVLLLVVNLFSSLLFKSVNIDLTESGLYTLSEGTKNILQHIDEPIRIDLYVSQNRVKNIPAISGYAQRVQELLEEYSSEADGKLKFRVIDPEPFSEQEDEAVKNGLQGVPVDNAGTLIYFGLVGRNSVDDKETVAFFQTDKEASLEYDLTRIVYRLSHSKQQTVGVLSSLPIAGNNTPTNPFMRKQAPTEWMMLSQIKQNFAVQTLEPTINAIPASIDVLMLVHPKGLSEATQFAIDQYVLGGGRALVFIDPYAEMEKPVADPSNPLTAMMAPRRSELDKLLSSWGVEMLADKIATDIDAASRVNINQGGRPQAVDYVAWLALKAENFATDDFSTAELKTINLASAGILQKKEGAGIEFTPLLQTGKHAMPVEVQKIQFGANPTGLLNAYKKGDKALVVAARISGKIKTAFPDGAPSGVELAEDKPALTESSEAINLIIVADTDILDDKFWVTIQNFFGQRIASPRANNNTFVLNALDNLSGSNDLISLRSRGNFSRPFDKVIALRKAAEERFREREKALKAKLSELESKLNEMQKGKTHDGNALILSQAQSAEIDKFRAQQVKTRKELRNVRHELEKDITSLGSTLKAINIGLVPILVIVFALLMQRRRNRKQMHLLLRRG